MGGMKAAAAKAMTKGALAESLATSAELRRVLSPSSWVTWERLAPLRQRRLAVHHPWPCQDQDSQETSNQSHQEDHVWQRNARKSKACQDCRQGIPSCCVEGQHLIFDCTGPFV